MSRRVKKPLRPAGDRPKGARPYRGSQAERPPHRTGSKAPPRYPAAPPRAPKPFVAEPEKVVVEPPPLPTKVQTVVVTADENNMRVDRFLEARFPGLSFSHIQRIVRKGELRVNGKRAPTARTGSRRGRAFAFHRSSSIRRRSPARCRKPRPRRCMRSGI